VNSLVLFAQAQRNAGADSAALGGMMCFLVMYLAVIVVVIASLWVIFTKAGKPGWAALIPIYNIVVLLEIVEKPIWWVILFLVPCVSLVVAILVYIELAKKFGKDVGFAIGMILLPMIFLPILAFGSAQYQSGKKRRTAEQDDYDDYDDRDRRRGRDEDEDDDRPRRRK
jgi:hypothetical protein